MSLISQDIFFKKNPIFNLRIIPRRRVGHIGRSLKFITLFFLDKFKRT
jgi:hypothetical protein